MIALILCHFLLHPLFFSWFSLLKSLSLSYFLHFSLAASLLSHVTFPLICPFSCKGNHPRYSLISGQGYQRLSSQLGLIASMLMTHRMGNWAPECRQRRWSLLCHPKPRLQIWPGNKKADIGLLVHSLFVRSYDCFDKYLLEHVSRKHLSYVKRVIQWSNKIIVMKYIINRIFTRHLSIKSIFFHLSSSMRGCYKVLCYSTAQHVQ